MQASGDDLVTLSKSDLEKAIVRFVTAKPPVKQDPLLLGDVTRTLHKAADLT